MFGNRGGSRAPIFFIILVLTIVGYIGIKTLPPYLAYYAMDDEINQQLQMTRVNNQELILTDVMKKAEELEIPITNDDVKIQNLENGNISIDISWVTNVDYGYGFTRDFPFEISASTIKTE